MRSSLDKLRFPMDSRQHWHCRTDHFRCKHHCNAEAHGCSWGENQPGHAFPRSARRVLLAVRGVSFDFVGGYQWQDCPPNLRVRPCQYHGTAVYLLLYHNVGRLHFILAEGGSKGGAQGRACAGSSCTICGSSGRSCPSLVVRHSFEALQGRKLSPVPQTGHGLL